MDQDTLFKWMLGQPAQIYLAVATRTTMRALPTLRGLRRFEHGIRYQRILPAFRLQAYCWWCAFVSDWGTLDPRKPRAISESADMSERIPYEMAQRRIALCYYPANFARVIFAENEAMAEREFPPDEAAKALFDLIDALGDLRAPMVEMIDRDCELVDAGMAPAQIAAQPLWHNPNSPEEIAHHWAQMKRSLHRTKEDWQVWTRWYDDRLLGRSVNQELEEARTIELSEEDWMAGPEITNGLLRKIEERFAGASSGGASQAALPDRMPTPVRFDIAGGKIRTVQPDPPDLPERRKGPAESAWRAVRQMLQDFLDIGGGRQDPRLSRALERCLGALSDRFDKLDQVMLGLHGATIDEFARRADHVLLPEAAAQLVAANGQLSVFLAQLPEWIDYRQGISAAMASPEDEQSAVRELAGSLQDVKEEAPGLVAEDARDALAVLEEQATPMPAVDGPDVASPVARRSFLRAGYDFFLKAASAVLTPVGKGAASGLDEGTKRLIKVAFVAASVKLLQLAQLLPSEFSWLRGVLAAIVKGMSG